VVRPHSDLLSYFLVALTSSEYGRSYFQNSAKQSTNLAIINSCQLKAFPVLLPPLAEQQAIAAVISTWDGAIRQIRQLIETKIKFKDGLMYQLLTGKRRFKFTDQWRTVSLKEVTQESEERNRGRLGNESVMAVTKTDGIVPMRERSIASDINRYLVVKKDWFAYNPMRLNIGSIARWTDDEEVLVSPDYVVFRCKEASDVAVDPEFLDQYRRSSLWERYVVSSGNGSVRIRIYFSDLSAMKLTIPPVVEQRKIAAVLNTADIEIELLTNQLHALKKQKQGLMQKLITGQLRMKL
jgi:type I restriction enzyme S subunit